MILAGDIGGTKTLLSLYEREGERLIPRHFGKFRSTEFETLDRLVHHFLSIHGADADSACFGVPGPVSEGAVRTTNLPWVLSEGELSQSVGIPKIRLVNDLVAMASGIPLLTSTQLETLHAGAVPEDGSVSVVVAPGTGLGHAMMHREGETVRVFGSEGGHVDFAPRNQIEFELLNYLLTKLKRVSVERLLSGPGLYNIYQFFRDTNRAPETREIVERFTSTEPAKVITDAAISEEDELCVKTVDLFIALLGAHCGNVMLMFMATAGIYLGGGIPPKIVSRLRKGDIVEHYVTKGRLSPLVEATPLYVVTDDRTGLHGAAHLASTL
jgi:glucokinase